MRDQRDPDLVLVDEMLSPPPLEDARRSLEYWQHRHRDLPLYRRRARREAVEMAQRWETRVRAAQQARFDSSPIGRLLAGFGIRLYAWRFTTKRGVLALAWAVVPRPVKLVAGGLAAAWLIVAAGVMATCVVLLAQLT